MMNKPVDLLDTITVSDFRFLGVHITEDLTLGTNTAELVKKAQQTLFSKGS